MIKIDRRYDRPRAEVLSVVYFVDKERLLLSGQTLIQLVHNRALSGLEKASMDNGISVLVAYLPGSVLFGSSTPRLLKHRKVGRKSYFSRNLRSRGAIIRRPQNVTFYVKTTL